MSGPATILAPPSLYVAYSPQTNAVRWFEVTDDLADDLADDLTQLDPDGIRRAYRRLNGAWFAYLHGRALSSQWAPIHARMVELLGPEKVARGESYVISFDYQLPRLSR